MTYQDEVRAKITEQIVTMLKCGQTPPWRKPWATVGPSLPTNISGRPYSGINVLTLLVAAMTKNYPVNLWGTYAQYRNANAQVRRGEKGTPIVLWKPVCRVKVNARGEEREETIPVMKTWTVFNVAQVDGYSMPSAQNDTTGFVDFTPAEEAVAATGAVIQHGGNRAYYSPATDHIQMPDKAAFESVQGYYETLLHEAIHWSQPRLGWKGNYPLEELVAELGGCFLCAELGVPNSGDLTNHASYVCSWVKELENDHAAVFRAAKQASLSATFILGFSRKDAAEGEDEEALEAAAR